MTLTSTGHSVYSATHAQTYEYLPTLVGRMPDVTQHECGAMFLYRTEKVWTYLLKWWLLCSLDPKCISPKSKLNCEDVYKRGRGHYANCHRYDQSAMNILMANTFGFEDKKYVNVENLAYVDRGSYGHEHVKLCLVGHSPRWQHVKQAFRQHEKEVFKTRRHDMLVI